MKAEIEGGNDEKECHKKSTKFMKCKELSKQRTYNLKDAFVVFSILWSKSHSS